MEYNSIQLQDHRTIERNRYYSIASHSVADSPQRARERMSMSRDQLGGHNTAALLMGNE